MESAHTSGNVTREVLALEQMLMRNGAECTRERLEQVLAEEFREVGKSGQVYDRDRIIHLLLETGERAIDMLEPAPDVVAPGVVLLRYKTSYAGSEVWRCSLWIERAGRWQILYHQGTPLP